MRGWSENPSALAYCQRLLCRGTLVDVAVGERGLPAASGEVDGPWPAAHA